MNLNLFFIWLWDLWFFFGIVKFFDVVEDGIFFLLVEILVLVMVLYLMNDVVGIF